MEGDDRRARIGEHSICFFLRLVVVQAEAVLPEHSDSLIDLWGIMTHRVHLETWRDWSLELHYIFNSFSAMVRSLSCLRVLEARLQNNRIAKWSSMEGKWVVNMKTSSVNWCHSFRSSLILREWHPNLAYSFPLPLFIGSVSASLLPLCDWLFPFNLTFLISQPLVSSASLSHCVRSKEKKVKWDLIT